MWYETVYAIACMLVKQIQVDSFHFTFLKEKVTSISIFFFIGLSQTVDVEEEQIEILYALCEYLS